MRRTLVILAGLTVASCGTDVAGPSSSLVSCLFLDPRPLAAGEALRVQGAGNQALCLEAADDDAAYLYIPFFAARAPGQDEDPVRLAVSVVGAGLAASVAAAPAGDAFGGSVTLDHDFHRRLRLREIAELEPRMRAVDPAAQVRAPEVAVGLDPVAAMPAVGETLEFNVAISCTLENVRPARVVHVSDHAIVTVEEGAAGGLSEDDFRFFAAAFDTLVHPLSVEHFGEPTDIDGNGRVIIFFTPAVNALSPPGGASIVGGFFWSGDLFPAEATSRLQACPGGNQAEMFYVMVPDPDGQWGPQIGVDLLRDIGVRIIGHEYQHLINAARRMYVNDATTFERTWLNEGLSHIAEELLFFHATGLARGANLTADDVRASDGAVTAFNRYAIGNFINLSHYLSRPDTASLMGPDGLATRGAAWSFLRYAADRAGRGDAPFFHDLVNATNAGLDNLDGVTDGASLGWMQDWTVSLYADDHVAGIAPEHTQPTWHKRDLYENIMDRYPLRIRSLAQGTPLTVSLRPGAAEFTAFGLGPQGRATIHVEADGRVPGRQLHGSILRIR